MSGKETSPGIWDLIFSESWTPFFLACSATRYDQAFAKLQGLWGPAWEAYTANSHFSTSDRDALALIVLCKAMISLNSGMFDASSQELLLGLGLYGWNDFDCLLNSMTKHLYGLTSPWMPKPRGKDPVIWSIPLPIFLLMVYIGTEISAAHDRALEGAEHLILASTFLHNFFQLPHRTITTENDGIHQSWVAKKIEKAASMTLLRATDLLCQAGHYLTAWEALDFCSSSSRTSNPALDLIRLRVAIQTGRHENAAAIVHNLERINTLSAAVAKGLLYRALGREDCVNAFEIALKLLDQCVNSNHKSVTKACLRNNIAVSHMCGMPPRIEFDLVSESSEIQENQQLVPTPYRLAGMLGQPAPPIYVIVRNVLTLNEFIPAGLSVKLMIKEAVVVQEIREKDILAELSKVSSTGDLN